MKFFALKIIAFLFILAVVVASCKEETPIIEPIVELELGCYTEIEETQQPEIVMNRFCFIDRDNLELYHIE
jgi:hypothetical protein